MSLAVRPAEGAAADDRCGLCLQVLADLWEVDAGLNEDITQLGVDLSGFTGLTEGEKAAVAYAFGMEHDILPVMGTWEELAEQGYIDMENLYWEDGASSPSPERSESSTRKSGVRAWGLFLPGLHRLHGTGRDLDLHGRRRGHRLSRISRQRGRLSPNSGQTASFYFILGNRKGEGALRVEVHIDPDCREPRVTITAPILTDEIRDLAARLEGGGGLTGWRGETAVPLREEAILRCFAQDKGVKAQTAEGVYDLRERLYELEARLDRHTFVRISHSEIVNLRKVTALDLSLTGTIKMTLAEGVVCYVSRRYVKKIKEALEL